MGIFKHALAVLAILTGTISGAFAGSYIPTDFKPLSNVDSGPSDPTNIKP